MDRIIEPIQERILEMTMNQRLTTMLLLLMMTTLVSANDVTSPELSARDQIRVAVQEICPISGQKLGGHGIPVKVKVGELEVFICCKPCLKKKIDPKYWSAIHKNIAAAQEICPVMKHKLPKKPAWTMVDGQIIFICCPPCKDDIAAEPKEFLEKVDDLYRKSLAQSSPSTRDAKSARLRTGAPAPK